MSYDLIAKSNPTHSGFVPRALAASVIAGIPNVHPNGPDCFVLKKGDEQWMEIDPALVSAEGDLTEANTGPDGQPSKEINSIAFHIPYAFMENVQPHLDVALEIAQALGWPLFDCQTDEVIAPHYEPKPWWKFWAR